MWKPLMILPMATFVSGVGTGQIGFGLGGKELETANMDNYEGLCCRAEKRNSVVAEKEKGVKIAILSG